MSEIKFSKDSSIIYLVDHKGRILLEMSRNWFDMLNPNRGKRTTMQEYKTILKGYYQRFIGENHKKTGNNISKLIRTDKSYSHHFQRVSTKIPLKNDEK